MQSESPHKEKRLSVFGATVLSLMMESGVTSQAQLAKMIHDPNGKPVRPARIWPWLRGVHSAPSWLPEEIADALSLSEEQMEKLAWAHTYGQSKFVKVGRG